jgi:hypothetical protein
VRHPRVTPGTSVDELVALLLAAKGSVDEQVKLVRAFADTRRPAVGSKEFASADRKFFFVVAANGTRAHPDGYDAAAGPPYPASEVILVGGNGKSSGLLARGGRGGTATHELFSNVVAIGGPGGAGLRGGNGGDADGFLGLPPRVFAMAANGGPGGAGIIGGAGGAGGGSGRSGGLGVTYVGLGGAGGSGLIGGDGGGM